MMCFRKSPAAKNYGYKKGCQDFPSKFFCLTMPENLSKEPFVLCFRKLLVANKIRDKRGTGGYQDVPSKVFCTTLPKNLRKGTLLCCVPEKFRLRKRLWIRNGDINIFPRKDFCLRVPEVS